MAEEKKIKKWKEVRSIQFRKLPVNQHLILTEGQAQFADGTSGTGRRYKISRRLENRTLKVVTINDYEIK